MATTHAELVQRAMSTVLGLSGVKLSGGKLSAEQKSTALAFFGAQLESYVGKSEGYTLADSGIVSETCKGVRDAIAKLLAKSGKDTADIGVVEVVSGDSESIIRRVVGAKDSGYQFFGGREGEASRSIGRKVDRSVKSGETPAPAAVAETVAPPSVIAAAPAKASAKAKGDAARKTVLGIGS
jgi:hypothetical protein